MNKENLLSKAEMKNIIGGNDDIDDVCIPNGGACNDSIQCCSLNCVLTGSGPTGKICIALP